MSEKKIFTDSGIVFQDGYGPPAFAGFDRAHEPGCSRPNDQNIFTSSFILRHDDGILGLICDMVNIKIFLQAAQNQPELTMSIMLNLQSLAKHLLI